MCVFDKDFPSFCLFVGCCCRTPFFRNYHGSRVLPICLLLLDAPTYKHSEVDIFDLIPYCQSDLGFDNLEINELNGYDLLKNKIESLEEKDSKKVVVYLYQSELRKQENVKEIIEFCLSCRV